MFVPRIFIVAGIALIAIALGASGHGLFWLIPFVWIVGGARRRAWYACGPGNRGRYGRYGDHGYYRDHYVDHGTPDQSHPTASTPPSDEPDPSRDRHEAFPSGH
ncbi:hypothetical protein GCM10027053_13840 [Intrasporangium mesophilum]